MTETVSPTQAAAKTVKSPMLTKLERLVYDRCEITGDLPEDALAFDDVLHKLIVNEVCDGIRVERIATKLDGSAKYLKHQVEKLRAGVRNRCDEPDADFVNKSLAESAAADRANA
jgi:hypothetical protein